jgi:hypothetical protein
MANAIQYETLRENITRSHMGPGFYDVPESFCGRATTSPTFNNYAYRRHRTNNIKLSALVDTPLPAPSTPSKITKPKIIKQKNILKDIKLNCPPPTKEDLDGVLNLPDYPYSPRNDFY